MELSYSELILLSAVVVFAHMALYYLLSLVKRDASIVDIGWGVGFVLLAWVLMLVTDEPSAIQRALTLLVSVWGLRLASHIYLRKRGKPEDWRYAKWRQDWGRTFWWRSFLQVFMLQGVFMLIMAAPLIIAAGDLTAEFNVLSWIGYIVWLIGFGFEAIGDWQLTNFLRTRKRKNQIMKTGLWRYTRHPNYFGEIAQWWGIWLIVLTLDYGWLAIISPLVITFLLLKVSGITMLEKKYDKNKEFQKYKKRTSPLFPLPPKKI